MKTAVVLFFALVFGTTNCIGQWSVEYNEFGQNYTAGFFGLSDGHFLSIANLKSSTYSSPILLASWNVDPDGNSGTVHIEGSSTQTVKRIVFHVSQGWNREVFVIDQFWHLTPWWDYRHASNTASVMRQDGSFRAIESTDFVNNDRMVRAMTDVSFGYAAVGLSPLSEDYEYVESLSKPWIRARDPQGNVIWELLLPQTTNDYFTQACRHPNNGLIALTKTTRKLIHVSDSGDVVLEINVDDIHPDLMIHRLKSDSTRILGIGSIPEDGGNGQQAVCFQLDADLMPESFTILPDVLSPCPRDFTTTADGGYVFIRSSQKDSPLVAVAVKTNSHYEVEWQSVYDGAFVNMFNEIEVPSITVIGVAEGDDGSIVIGGTATYPEGNRMTTFAFDSDGTVPESGHFTTLDGPFDGHCGELVRITNVIGQEVHPEPGQLLLYHYEGGCMKKVIIQ